MLKGNKGEWSEIYALFKLLGDKKLYAGDSDLRKIHNLFYPIIKILRKEAEGKFEYTLDADLVVISDENEPMRVPVKTFSEQAIKLLEQIKSSQGAFSLPDIEDFMKSIKCKSLKASSKSKTDITIVVHDTILNQSTQLGFSIKSQLGSQPTLLNPGKNTNFIYQIKNFEGKESKIEQINGISTTSKIKDRIAEIHALGGELVFHSLENKVFNNNLVLIDSSMPVILAELVKAFFTSSNSKVNDLVEVMRVRNPLGYDMDHTHPFYEYKVKRFLTDVALGMTPSSVWNGLYDANGGYLIVKENGDVLCYHVYNKNKFEDYLFYNTKLDTASSTRYNFGTIYEENGLYFFKLNLQIRFC